MVCMGHHGRRPASLTAAAFEQHPELEQLLSKLSTKLAMCEITPSDELIDKLLGRIQEANERQAAKGSKANWLKVIFRADKKRENPNDKMKE